MSSYGFIAVGVKNFCTSRRYAVCSGGSTWAGSTGVAPLMCGMVMPLVTVKFL